MREGYYYSLLKTNADKEILAMPIEALGIRSSVLEDLQRVKAVSASGKRNAISSIGDLINYGYSGLIAYFSITKPTYDELREKFYDEGKGNKEA